MNKIINLGKIDFNKTGKKINLVTIEVELEEKEDKKVLSICGNIWNSKQTDTIHCGQCLDTLKPYFKSNELFNEVYRLWKLYHLNDMHAGTQKQEKFLKDNNIENWANDYTETCEFLEKNNLLYDNGYKFGSKWLYEEIPAEDLKKIIDLI